MSRFYDPSLLEYPLVGAVMVDDSLVAYLEEIISPSDFQLDDAMSIWSTVVELKREGKAADVISVSERSGLEIHVLAEIARNCYSTSLSSARTWANEVRERAKLRRLKITLQLAAEQASEQDADVESVAARTRDLLMGLDDDNSKPRRTTKQILQDRINAFDRRYNGEESPMGISTGLSELDQLISGLKPSEMILLAARPGMGKSTVALKFAEQAACHQGKRVAFFSLEMSNDETIDRLIIMKSGMVSTAFSDPKRYRTEPYQVEGFGPAIAAIDNADLNFFDDVFTVEGIAAKCRSLHQQQPLDLVVIDYIQLMTSKNAGKYGGNRVLEVGDYSRSLKMLAMSLNCPVVALSQLNREVEKRNDKRPMMADLRESGSLEQDANKILMLYIDQVYNEQSDRKGIAEILVRKNRGGSVGTIYTSVDLSRYSFQNHTPDRYAQQARESGMSVDPFE